MLVSMVPPRNDCGVRIVMYRHLVEKSPFHLHVASNADFSDGLLIDTQLTLPWFVEKLRKSRIGPAFGLWIKDYINLVWPLTGCPALERAIESFKPDVILTLAETGISELARRAAVRRKIPLAVLFLDWFPVMKSCAGHSWTKRFLDRRFRRLYVQCQVAICTSDGMREVLGPHPNSHIVYPMPGRHKAPTAVVPPKTDKFRLVYAGAAEGFYGSMLRALWKELKAGPGVELIIVGPCGDWPPEDAAAAKAEGVALGFMPPEKAAEVSAGADALLVVMSFEKEHELFMRTSFTTKFLDYSAFGKPIILWGPDYCTPVRVAAREKAALVVSSPEPAEVAGAIALLAKCPEDRQKFAVAAIRLAEGLFNPDRLQKSFVDAVSRIAVG